jgi:glutaredoxin-related protein
LPVYAQCPSCPRAWVNDELIEGDDIVSELNQGGESKRIISAAVKHIESKEVNPNSA